MLIDPVKAKGRKDLVDACPYGHIWWNEELSVPQAWTFDAHLHRSGLETDPRAAILSNRRHARDHVDDDEMQQMVREQELEVMKPELNAKPRVYYRNLWRYSKCFIGGTLSAKTGEGVDCVEGAKVRLMKDNRHRG